MLNTKKQCKQNLRQFVKIFIFFLKDKIRFIHLVQNDYVIGNAVEMLFVSGDGLLDLKEDCSS